METYPLKSLTLEEAMDLQFSLVDAVTREFPGNQILTCGDLGVVSGFNQPVTTRKVENVLKNFFDSEDVLLVRGSGTNAIRLALYSVFDRKENILVHDAPIYPTTKISLDMLGLQTIVANFNNFDDVKEKLKNKKVNGILIQVTRQKITDEYNLEELVAFIRSIEPNIPIITDDNYSALKTKSLGSQIGATLSCFSTFKLLGPEGIGCIVGEKQYIEKLRSQNYSGGGQVQGHEALDVIKGMVYAPVSLAISARVCEETCQKLNNGKVNMVDKAYIVNAQSKVIIVELTQPIAKKVIQYACEMGALPNPVGAESKYEFSPLFYRVSATFRASIENADDYLIRINPNRSGSNTILRILEEAINKVL